MNILTSETLHSFAGKPLKAADIKDGDHIKALIEGLRELPDCYRQGGPTESFQQGKK